MTQTFTHPRQASTQSRPAISMQCRLCGRVCTRYVLMRRIVGHLEQLESNVRVTLTMRCPDCRSRMATKVKVTRDRKVKYEEITTYLVEIGSRRRQ